VFDEAHRLRAQNRRVRDDAEVARIESRELQERARKIRDERR